MKATNQLGLLCALLLALTGAVLAAPTGASMPMRPPGPCDVYAAAGTPCAAAHSTTRALFAGYDGPLYQVMRQSDGAKRNIGVVQPSAADAGGYADAAAQDRFCAGTICWIATIYDQARKGNDLTQAPRGAFSGPAMGGFNNLPIADMAPVTLMGHKVYGVFIAPGMGLRQNNAKGTAVDDQAEGQYWVINGQHYNSGCCFDYGNAEIDSRDDDNGTMETTYFGNSASWFHGGAPGPWVMTDQENNLVGCSNRDGSKFCPNLPSVDWRFVTAMAKGEPHHWTSLGGDARQGPLRVMFDGPRVNGTYDPMRKQGAILLGNGGDNSNSSQGTFYEGAMTAAGTFPTDATDQKIQANVVAAGYDLPRLTIAPAAQVAAPTGLQDFAPGSTEETGVTFTNTSGAPVRGLVISLALPKGWSSDGVRHFAGPIAPGAAVTATFKVTSGAAAFNGDLVAHAAWAGHADSAVQKVRNVNPIRINEFRAGDPANASNAFIELFNAGSQDVDLSNWTFTQHPTQSVISSHVTIPAGTHLAARGFYLLGLSTSGLAADAHAGDAILALRSVAGISAGDTVTIGAGAGSESRKVTAVGSAAEAATTVWQPQPDGLITIPAGATNVPVTSNAGFAVGQKIALGHGATYPAVSRGQEQYEIATVTAVGTAGVQAFLGADARPGDTSLKVTNVAAIAAGDRIRLDIASKGHGVETVTVKRVGSPAMRTNLTAEARMGATGIRVRNTAGFAVGHTLNIGTPANRQAVTITAIDVTPQTSGRGQGGGAFNAQPGGVTFAPALVADHVADEHVVDPGTGLELAAPLKFAHAANLPFAARGAGISFAPATRFAHASNEPVQALGSGITLDRPLDRPHAVDAVVQDAAAMNVGYQGPAKPNQLFGGPALSGGAGAMVLRDAAGHVVDSLNYGLLVDPWASPGYHGISGTGATGCRAIAPGRLAGRPPVFGPITTNSSTGRFPDGADSNSNCNDFLTQGATVLPLGAQAGSATLSVAAVTDFAPGQAITIDSDAGQETATIAAIGTAGAATLDGAAKAGDTIVGVAGAAGFTAGQAILVDTGANQEHATVTVVQGGRGAARITLAAALGKAHAAGAAVTGTGLTLTAPLARAHAAGSHVGSELPTPGAPNRYAPVR